MAGLDPAIHAFFRIKKQKPGSNDPGFFLSKPSPLRGEGREGVSFFPHRHCEEQSDAAIQFNSAKKDGLLRSARNDESGAAPNPTPTNPPCLDLIWASTSFRYVELFPFGRWVQWRMATKEFQTLCVFSPPDFKSFYRFVWCANQALHFIK